MDIYRLTFIFGLVLTIFCSCQVSTEEAALYTSFLNRDFKEVPISLITDDFNNDGNLDVAISEIQPSRLKIMYAPNNESGNLNAPIQLPIGNEPRRIYSSDVNGDLFSDLFSVNYFDDQIEIKLNNGSGNFLPSTFINTVSNPVDLKFADINSASDNFPDLMVLSQNNKTVEVFIGDGSGGFALDDSYPVGTLPQGLEIADLNNDGAMDFIVPNFENQNASIYLGSAPGFFTAQPEFALPSAPTDIKLADYNEDGNIDMAVVLTLDRQINIYAGDGTGGFNPVELDSLSTRENLIAYSLIEDSIATLQGRLISS